MIKSLFKRITGIDKIEAATAKAEELLQNAVSRAAEAVKSADAAIATEELAKSTPKERATQKGEPWVTVLETHVNKDNIRNGFFELDWNDLFVLKLKQEGYGFDGDPNEEIVDRWFRELCSNVVGDDGYDGPITTGTLNIADVKKNNQ